MTWLQLKKIMKRSIGVSKLPRRNGELVIHKKYLQPTFIPKYCSLIRYERKTLSELVRAEILKLSLISSFRWHNASPFWKKHSPVDTEAQKIGTAKKRGQAWAVTYSSIATLQAVDTCSRSSQPAIQHEQCFGRRWVKDKSNH
jgi:hypothetical protein